MTSYRSIADGVFAFYYVLNNSIKYIYYTKIYKYSLSGMTPDTNSNTKSNTNCISNTISICTSVSIIILIPYSNTNCY